MFVRRARNAAVRTFKLNVPVTGRRHGHVGIITVFSRALVPYRVFAN